VDETVSDCQQGYEIFLFSKTCRQDLGPTQPPIPQALFPQSVKLTTHWYVLSSLRINGAILLLPLHACMTCPGTVWVISLTAFTKQYFKGLVLIHSWQYRLQYYVIQFPSICNVEPYIKKDPGSKSHIWITLVRQITTLHKIAKLARDSSRTYWPLEDKRAKCTMILQNIWNRSPEAASHPRRPQSPEFSCCINVLIKHNIGTSQ
jgi:hypothetical protein